MKTCNNHRKANIIQFEYDQKNSGDDDNKKKDDEAPSNIKEIRINHRVADANLSLLAIQHSNLATPVTQHPLGKGCDDNWTWNPEAKSHDVLLRGANRRTAHFHPNLSFGTAGIRGTKVLNQGRYYWEVHVTERIFGTSMMVGIGTEKARLHANKCVNMLGENGESWGLSHIVGGAI